MTELYVIALATCEDALYSLLCNDDDFLELRRPERKFCSLDEARQFLPQVSPAAASSGSLPRIGRWIAVFSSAAGTARGKSSLESQPLTSEGAKGVSVPSFTSSASASSGNVAGTPLLATTTSTATHSSSAAPVVQAPNAPSQFQQKQQQQQQPQNFMSGNFQQQQQPRNQNFNSNFQQQQRQQPIFQQEPLQQNVNNTNDEMDNNDNNNNMAPARRERSPPNYQQQQQQQFNDTRNQQQQFNAPPPASSYNRGGAGGGGSDMNADKRFTLYIGWGADSVQDPRMGDLRDYLTKNYYCSVLSIFCPPRKKFCFVSFGNKADMDKMLAIRNFQMNAFNFTVKPAVPKGDSVPTNANYNQNQQNQQQNNPRNMSSYGNTQQQQQGQGEANYNNTSPLLNQMQQVISNFATGAAPPPSYEKSLLSQDQIPRNDSTDNMMMMQQQQSQQTQQPSKTILISNLPTSVTEEEVFYRLFPHEPELILLVETTNCASVSYDNEENAEKALSFLSGKTLKKNLLSVKYV